MKSNLQDLYVDESVDTLWENLLDNVSVLPDEEDEALCIRRNGNYYEVANSDTDEAIYTEHKTAAGKLKFHVGHGICCNSYGNSENIFTISIDCVDCAETLFCIDSPDAN